MYTYTKTFAGVPLSQLNKNQKTKLITFWKDLTDYRFNDLDVDVLEDFDFQCENDKRLATILINWLVNKRADFLAAGYDFCSDYHGDMENPCIFGKYIDLGLDEGLATKVDVKKAFAESIKYEEEAEKLFMDFPEELKNEIKEGWRAGVWTNQHSS